MERLLARHDISASFGMIFIWGVEVLFLSSGSQPHRCHLTSKLNSETVPVLPSLDPSLIFPFHILHFTWLYIYILRGGFTYIVYKTTRIYCGYILAYIYSIAYIVHLQYKRYFTNT